MRRRARSRRAAFWRRCCSSAIRRASRMTSERIAGMMRGVRPAEIDDLVGSSMRNMKRRVLRTPSCRLGLVTSWLCGPSLPPARPLLSAAARGPAEPGRRRHSGDRRLSPADPRGADRPPARQTERADPVAARPARPVANRPARPKRRPSRPIRRPSGSSTCSVWRTCKSCREARKSSGSCNVLPVSRFITRTYEFFTLVLGCSRHSGWMMMDSTRKSY